MMMVSKMAPDRNNIGKSTPFDIERGTPTRLYRVTVRVVPC